MKPPSVLNLSIRSGKRSAATRDPRSREQLQRRIDATDAKIDRLVYELYELTPDEIAIVEHNT